MQSCNATAWSVHRAAQAMARRSPPPDKPPRVLAHGRGCVRGIRRCRRLTVPPTQGRPAGADAARPRLASPAGPQSRSRDQRSSGSHARCASRLGAGRRGRGCGTRTGGRRAAVRGPAPGRGATPLRGRWSPHRAVAAVDLGDVPVGHDAGRRWRLRRRVHAAAAAAAGPAGDGMDGDLGRGAAGRHEGRRAAPTCRHHRCDGVGVDQYERRRRPACRDGARCAGGRARA